MTLLGPLLNKDLKLTLITDYFFPHLQKITKKEPLVKIDHQINEIEMQDKPLTEDISEGKDN
jgi:hypothetical protein